MIWVVKKKSVMFRGKRGDEWLYKGRMSYVDAVSFSYSRKINKTKSIELNKRNS